MRDPAGEGVGTYGALLDDLTDLARSGRETEVARIRWRLRHVVRHGSISEVHAEVAATWRAVDSLRRST